MSNIPVVATPGRLVYAERQWPPLKVWPIIAVLSVPAGFLKAARPGLPFGELVVTIVIMFLVFGIFVLTGGFHQIQVHENAVVVRTARQPAEVIPLDSIDVGRIRFHRRAHDIERRLHKTYPPGSSTRTHLRIAWIGGARAVSFWGGPGGDQLWVVGTQNPHRLLGAIQSVLSEARPHDPAMGQLRDQALANPVLERRWPLPSLTDADIYGAS